VRSVKRLGAIERELHLHMTALVTKNQGSIVLVRLSFFAFSTLLL
jgi:hypothetical protein